MIVLRRLQLSNHVAYSEGYHTCIVALTERLPYISTVTYSYLYSYIYIYIRPGLGYNIVTSDLWQGAAPPLST